MGVPGVEPGLWVGGRTRPDHGTPMGRGGLAGGSPGPANPAAFGATKILLHPQCGLFPETAVHSAVLAPALCLGAVRADRLSRHLRAKLAPDRRRDVRGAA